MEKPVAEGSKHASGRDNRHTLAQVREFVAQAWIP